MPRTTFSTGYATKLLPLTAHPSHRIALWAQARRTALGLTQEAIAKRSRLRQEDIAHFETMGDAEGTREARRLARAYDVPVLVLEIWLGYFRLADLEELLRWFADASSN